MQLLQGDAQAAPLNDVLHGQREKTSIRVSARPRLALPRPELLPGRTRSCWPLWNVLWKSKHFHFLKRILAQEENLENTDMNSEVNMHHLKIPLEMLTDMILALFPPLASSVPFYKMHLYHLQSHISEAV